MTLKQFEQMLLFVAQEMQAHTQELCQLDSYIGDGDHGMTIERGFKAVEESIHEETFETPGDMLKTVGNAFMNAAGGAIGPILGSFFRGGYKKLTDAKEMSTDEFEIMLTAGLRQVKMTGEAKEGDRTLVDALSPACNAYTEAKAAGGDLKACLLKAAEAAEAGAESTRNMVAHKGRAKFLGEQSLGYVDAGATSMSIILRAMSNYVNL